MFRGLLKLVLVVIVVVAAGAFLLGWWGGGRTLRTEVPQEVGTAGEKARAAGSEVGEKTARAADRTAAAAETAKDRTAAAAETAKDRTAAAAEVAREKTAVAASRAQKAIAEGSLTAKIKAKMALDDHVKALNLNVDTVGTVVTVTGIVNTEAERVRALQLARETAGVTQVVDKLQVRR